MNSIQETIWENITKTPLKSSLEGKYYRLSEWPNFGFSKYSPDFIVLSAHLTKKFLNKNELLKLINADDHIVNHFLNASSLLQILEVSERSVEPTTFESSTNIFTLKLKKIFGFN